jgi:hypothetical protein
MSEGYEEELIVHVEDPPKFVAGSKNTSLLERQMRDTSRTITINCFLVVIMSIACMVVLGVIIAVSSSLIKEKKIFLSTVMGVLLTGCQVVLCVSWKDPNTLIVFSTITAFVCGFCLGLTIWYF